MKGNHYCFEKNVSDRKGSIFGYGATPFSRVEVRITGQGALSSLKKTLFWFDGGSPFLVPKLRILRSSYQPSSGIRTHPHQQSFLQPMHQ